MLTHPFSTSNIQYVRQSELGERFTRDEALMLATRGVTRHPDGVTLVIIDDELEWDGLPIEFATMNFTPRSNGGWWLTYVSHPTYSRGVTAEVKPTPEDFVAFIEACKQEGSLGRLSLYCTALMVAEELGPLALLDLRPFGGVAQVPEQADMQFLNALASHGAAN